MAESYLVDTDSGKMGSVTRISGYPSIRIQALQCSAGGAVVQAIDSPRETPQRRSDAHGAATSAARRAGIYAKCL